MGDPQAIGVGPEPRPGIRPLVLVGLAIVALFFGVFVGWAGLAPLRSAAIAPGFVNVDSNRKKVKHLEGGIIRKILVRDGHEVKTGQVLVRLDDTQPRANLDLLRGRYFAVLALGARLKAERDGRQRIQFPPIFRKGQRDPRIGKLARGQVRIFVARRRALADRIATLKQRNAAYAEEIKGLEGQLASEAAELRLIGREIRVVRRLLRKQLARRPRLLALQRRKAQIEGQQSLNLARIGRARQGINEVRLKVVELRAERMKEVVQELRDVQTKLFDLTEKLRSAKDVHKRTVIRAPRDGTVVGLQVHTPGGVVSPGETLLEIVPSGDRLIIEARIDPNDIDVVHKGQSAQVRLTPFNQRSTAPLPGRVVSISADRMTEPRTGRSFYLARIELDHSAGSAIRVTDLYPGMPAEVMVDTGARTALDYLAAPVMRSLDRAFRER